MSHNYLMNVYASYPLKLVSGTGAFVIDGDGNRYLDFLSGIACTPLGHCHPAVLSAVQRQLDQLWHTSNLYSSSVNIALAKSWVDAGGLDALFFCNSGAEANEAAIKFARKYHVRQDRPRQYKILTATHSFHGRTLGALAATGKPSIQSGFGPMPAGFLHHDWNDIVGFCEKIDEQVAAVLLEPIQGEGGVHVAPPGFLLAVRAACDHAGALLILDEVQSGMGRTGTLFAYQSMGITPDMISMAKGIANGLPLGAVCVTQKVASCIQPGDHGTTFGGNPISCSAAIETLSVLLKENYLSQVQILGAYLASELRDLQQRYSEFIGAVRGMGLMQGMEMVNAHLAQKILIDSRKNGVLLNVVADKVIRFLPPYVITKADIKYVIDVIDQSLVSRI